MMTWLLAYRIWSLRMHTYTCPFCRLETRSSSSICIITTFLSIRFVISFQCTIVIENLHIFMYEVNHMLSYIYVCYYCLHLQSTKYCQTEKVKSGLKLLNVFTNLFRFKNVYFWPKEFKQESVIIFKEKCSNMFSGNSFIHQWNESSFFNMSINFQ